MTCTKNKDFYDFSEYPENSPFFDNTNKKVLGKFKDESCGVPIREFIGLCPKMYSVLHDNEKQKKTAKGIKTNVIKKNLLMIYIVRHCRIENHPAAE